MKESDFRKYFRSQHPFKMSYFDDFTSDRTMSGVMPYIIEERPLNISQLDIFSRLMMERQLFYRGEVDQDGASIIVSQMLYLDSKGDTDITMYIATYGGDIMAGLSIYDTIQIIKSDVKTVCTSVAASMGSILLVGGTAGKRAALKNSTILLHQPLSGVKGQASDIEIEARLIVSFKERLYRIINEHSGKPMEDIYRDADRNYWMDSEMALNYGSLGIIDSIITKDGLITREGKVGTGEMKEYKKKKKPIAKKSKKKEAETTSEEKPAEGKEE